jgi:hypothetical protein
MPAPETLLVTKIGESFDATPACRAVPAQMWAGWAQSRRRWGGVGPSAGVDVGGAGPVPAQMWAG